MTNRKQSVVFDEPDKREDLNEASKKCRRTDGVREENEGTESSLRPLPYYSLFQYANTREKSFIGLAVILAVFNGCVPPIISILYGEFCNMLVDRQYPTEAPSTKTFLLEWFGGGRILINASHEERRKALEEDSAAWSLGCATFTFCQFLVSTSSVFLLNYTALEQVSRIQVLFFKSVVCQGMAWFDTRMDGNFVGKASENLNQILNGTGGIIGIFVYLMVIFVFGVIVSLTYGWKLTLAILSTAPISIATSSIAAKVQSKLGMKEMRAWTAAGKIAEEVFGSIRTVLAFGGEQKEVARYSKKLEISKCNGIRRAVASGISGGVLWFIIYSSYGIAFAYGVRLLKNSKDDGNEEYTPAVLLIVFYGIFTGLINVGFASAHVEAFSRACVAASSIFDTIKTEPEINPCSERGKIGKGCRGEIEFKNVRFEYPSRPQVQILKGINFKIKPGETVAIVGGSGSGKSTILQLIQRLYDPSEGEILLDGENINELRVSWLREQLGVVGQEPALFATSIRENISYGSSASVISEEDIIECSKLANAHDFIMKEPNNYESVIGEKGSTLSGGQKQRIAIARALIRKPKVLLLDEATSALDSANEAIVQSTIDRAAQGRTTLIVTHRLSTIQHVHRIIVIANGVVVEEGNHAELFESRGFYYNLFEAQKGIRKKENKRLNEVSTPISLTYENVSSTFLPSTPRSRYSSLSAFSTFSNESRVKKSQRPDQYKEVNLMQILMWNKKEWSFLLVGSAASVIAGAALPVVSVLFGNLFGLLSLKNFEDILEGTDLYSVILVIVGLVAGFCVFLQMYCFSYSEMSLTTRLRVKAFTSMLNQEMGWFDEEGNRVGALCLRLTRDVSGLQGATGSRLGIIVQAFSTMTIGIVLSFFFTWNMTLVTLATIPFVFGGVYLESIFVRGSKYAVNKSMESASKIAAEVISNIRIVACLGRETYFIAKYTDAIEEGRKSNVKRGFLRALAFAVGQTAPFFGYAISLWYGGYLVASENLHYKYVIMVSELLIFGAWTLGQCVVLAPSFREAREAAGRLHYIFTRKAEGNRGELAGYLDMRKIDALTYSKVNFAYPTRPGAVVLRDFDAKIPARQSIAVVGPSGSGKSTIIQLLLRYYEPTSGKIAVNNVPLKDYRISSLRKRMGLVSQEPTLFDRTIEENIAYGDNSRTVTTAEIITAAKAANIHNFIMTLPLGYGTKLGANGTQLSGGQKQRIAIARALIRNPEILLLDEATSALDPESESIVQEALDAAAAGRTTITIAHRMRAVRNADVIYVVEKGAVREFGTHQHLMNQKGVYYSIFSDHLIKN